MTDTNDNKKSKPAIANAAVHETGAILLACPVNESEGSTIQNTSGQINSALYWKAR
jgi:hypothetical protein